MICYQLPTQLLAYVILYYSSYASMLPTIAFFFFILLLFPLSALFLVRVFVVAATVAVSDFAPLYIFFFLSYAVLKLEDEKSLVETI